MAAHTDPREVAAQVVRRVIDDGAYSQLALRVELDRAALDGRDRAFATALVYETLTWLGRIDAALDARLPKGLRSLRPDVRARMRVAAAQILSSSLRTPGWAARAEAVKATREPTLRRVVDAVLRRIEPVEPPADLDRIGLLAHHGSVPRWIAEHLDAALGPDAAAACDAFNAPTPATVRMRRDGERDTMVAALGAAGLDAVAHPIVPTAIVVRHGDVARTAEHARGEVIVQDAGAQLATLALPPRLEDGAPVLDVAAGLGGKSLHLASRYGCAGVIAVDRDLDKRRPMGATGGPAGRRRRSRALRGGPARCAVLRAGHDRSAPRGAVEPQAGDRRGPRGDAGGDAPRVRPARRARRLAPLLRVHLHARRDRRRGARVPRRERRLRARAAFCRRCEPGHRLGGAR